MLSTHIIQAKNLTDAKISFLKTHPEKTIVSIRLERSQDEEVNFTGKEYGKRAYLVSAIKRSLKEG